MLFSTASYVLILENSVIISISFVRLFVLILLKREQRKWIEITMTDGLIMIMSR